MPMTPTARQASVLARFHRAYWLFGIILKKDPQGFRLGWVRLISLHAIFPALALLAGYVDDTTRLRPAGRGVFEHYGFHALFISAPVLVLLTWRVIGTLARLISEPLPALSPSAATGLSSLQHELQDVVLCRVPRGKQLLLLFRLVGVFAVVANADSTRHPVDVYGQDVFDSSGHAVGYLAGRIFLSYYWIYLLPLVLYLAAASIAVAAKIAAYIDALPDYDVRCFASDRCGGFKELGRLMTLVVYLWVPIVFVIIALKETHANFYGTLRLSFFLCAIIPSQLYLPFLRLHRVLSRLKERKLAALERFLVRNEKAIDIKDDTRGGDSSGSSLHERRALPYLKLLAGDSVYRHTAEMTTWPYIRSDALRWVTPFVPLAVSLVFKRLGWS